MPERYVPPPPAPPPGVPDPPGHPCGGASVDDPVILLPAPGGPEE